MSAKKKIFDFTTSPFDERAQYFTMCNTDVDPVPVMAKKKKKEIREAKKVKQIAEKAEKAKKEAAEEAKIKKIDYPKSRKQQKKDDERHRKEQEKYFVCKKEVTRLPSPIDMAAAAKVPETPSPYFKEEERIAPRKLTFVKSHPGFPKIMTHDELQAIEPVLLQGTDEKDTSRSPVDSFSYVYDEKYRQAHPWYKMYTAPTEADLLETQLNTLLQFALDGEESEEEEEEVTVEEEAEKEEEPEVKEDEALLLDEAEMQMLAYEGEEEKEEPPQSVNLEEVISEVVYGDTMKSAVKKILSNFSSLYVEEEEERPESIRTKFSAATSIDTAYQIDYDQLRYPDVTPSTTTRSSTVVKVVSRMLEKYQGDSAEKLDEPKDKGLFDSETIIQPFKKPRRFFFGIKMGSIHYGDESFPPESRYRQSLAIVAVAYVFAVLKHPIKWKTTDIDRIVEMGDKLYCRSLRDLHIHGVDRLLTAAELCDIVTIDDKSVRYRIDDPDVNGMTMSQDPKVLDLYAGLTVFFKRNRSGVFQTFGVNILIWKQKHYFVFDAAPRTQELYCNSKGAAAIVNFYDLRSVVVMLIERGGLSNQPYMISKISVRKMEGDIRKPPIRKEEEYVIVEPERAVLCASFNLSDRCFEFSKNRQALAMCALALIYANLTPASAWNKRTLNKIMLVGNQLYLEVCKKSKIMDMRLEHVPGFLTLGPLSVEIVIFANQFAGLMYKKSMCLFAELLEKMLQRASRAIVEIDQATVAIWRDRDMYFLFDPYSRNENGLKTLNGTACVAMNDNIGSLIELVLSNFPKKDAIFKFHVLKVVKLNRDPNYSVLRKDSELSAIGDIKFSPKPALYKPVTVDLTELAAQTKPADAYGQGSILEIGSMVASLDERYVPDIHGVPSTTIAQIEDDVICDLDSPSLSDTQIDKKGPDPEKDEFELRYLEELLKEEEKLMELMQLGEGECEEMDAVMEELELFKDEIIQKGRDKFAFLVNEEMNTDLTGIDPPPRILLEPADAPEHFTEDWPEQERYIRDEDRKLKITQSEELRKETKYMTLPDDSQIIYGTMNITQVHQEYEKLSPFVSMMAVVLIKKYSLGTWSQEIVDFVMQLGKEVMAAIEIEFSKVPKLEIPRLSIGSTDFNVVSDYLFDSLLEPSILENALAKLLFRKEEGGIVVTHNYSCAVFCKYSLYYMYDAFGSNLVGLGEGPSNEGVACMFRFKTLKDLIRRFIYNKKKRETLQPKEASRFVLCTVHGRSLLPKKKTTAEQQAQPPPNDVFSVTIKTKKAFGYQLDDGYYLIRGTKGLADRSNTDNEIKECHFVCACAMIGLFHRSLRQWDPDRIDYIIDQGNNLFGYVDNPKLAGQRTVKNLLIDKYFFDVVIKQLKVIDPNRNKTFMGALRYLVSKNKYLMLQTTNTCYLIFTTKNYCHLFDPYGLMDDGKACWIRFNTLDQLQMFLKQSNKENMYFFFTVNVSNIKKASKGVRLAYKLDSAKRRRKVKFDSKELIDEEEEWLTIFPIPWSRMMKTVASGPVRGRKDYKWNNWDVEYPGDLFSLTGTIHQNDDSFAAPLRGKQTMANCVVCVVMTYLYKLSDWNAAILDSILRNGYRHFILSLKAVRDAQETIDAVRISDLRKTVSVFPYEVTVDHYPVVQGLMFFKLQDRFNLSRALRYFFDTAEKRNGMIICAEHGRCLAFGRLAPTEYYMYDCQTLGPPMFVDLAHSASYILRCHTLNRLLYLLSLSLRGGEFFLYHVSMESLDANEKVTGVTDMEGEEGGEEPAEEAAPEAPPVEEAKQNTENERLEAEAEEQPPAEGGEEE